MDDRAKTIRREEMAGDLLGENPAILKIAAIVPLCVPG